MIHECKQIEETVNRLHKDLKKRLSEVEIRLSSQNRSDLFSGGSASSDSRSAVEGKEAAVRLRKVNDDVGRIIKGGQVRNTPTDKNRTSVSLNSGGTRTID